MFICSPVRIVAELQKYQDKKEKEKNYVLLSNISDSF